MELTQTRSGMRPPEWEFEPAIWPAVPELSRALRTTEGWALLAFLESPLGTLDGLNPREALGRGQRDRVMPLAAGEGN
ncbi:hypothetical protein [Rubrivivax gelatinosus]|nr:hypothetical protein [Rubrivivax gelatinosus]